MGRIGGLVITVLILFFCYQLQRTVKKNSRKVGIESIVEYGVIPKTSSITALVLALIFTVDVVIRPYNDKIFALVMGIFILAITLCMARKTFFLKVRYDNYGLYYRSPLGKSVLALWAELETVGSSKKNDMKYIILKGKGKIWYSDWMDGFEEFDGFVREKARRYGATYGCRPSIFRILLGGLRKGGKTLRKWN